MKADHKVTTIASSMMADGMKWIQGLFGANKVHDAGSVKFELRFTIFGEKGGPLDDPIHGHAHVV